MQPPRYPKNSKWGSLERKLYYVALDHWLKHHSKSRIRKRRRQWFKLAKSARHNYKCWHCKDVISKGENVWRYNNRDQKTFCCLKCIKLHTLLFCIKEANEEERPRLIVKYHKIEFGA